MMTKMPAHISANIDRWLSGNYDAETKSAIQTLIDDNNETELSDAFYKDLEFGTGGLRGIMGPGTNRINRYTIAMATQGFSNYLLKNYKDREVSVALTHDSRNNHRAFADVVADVFSANGITVYYFDEMRPTPELSFAIRVLNCVGGVMLTASHNPREYNGYKAYNHEGAQLLSPHDQYVIDEVRAIKGIDDVNWDRNHDLVKSIGAEIDEQFLSEIEKLSINHDAIKRHHDIKIVYSPLHGVGASMVPAILRRYGFTNIYPVVEQMVPDGNFPTVVYPNPEEEEALTLSLNKAKEIDADLVMATDPDADRVGVALKNDDGEFILLNGNQTGTLIINYMLSAWEEMGKLTGNEYIVKTIVTSYLQDKIAESKNVECYNTLTGFKHICSVMTRLKDQKTFICGGEESYGYLIGEHVRDKDAIVSCAILAEMTAYYRDKGSSLFEALLDIYVEHGFYKEKLLAVVKKGKSGAEEIKSMMDNFRSDPPKTLGGSTIVEVKDYLSGKGRHLVNNTESTLDTPSSNVLQFITEDGSIVSCRPSGTEPKIKFYCSVQAPLDKRENYRHVETQLDGKLEAMIRDLYER